MYFILTWVFKKLTMQHCRGHWYKGYIKYYKIDLYSYDTEILYFSWNNYVSNGHLQHCLCSSEGASSDWYVWCCNWHCHWRWVCSQSILVKILWYEIWKLCGSSFCGLSFAVLSVHSAFYMCHMITKLNTFDTLETRCHRKGSHLLEKCQSSRI